MGLKVGDVPIRMHDQDSLDQRWYHPRCFLLCVSCARNRSPLQQNELLLMVEISYSTIMYAIHADRSYTGVRPVDLQGLKGKDYYYRGRIL